MFYWNHCIISSLLYALHSLYCILRISADIFKYCSPNIKYLYMNIEFCPNEYEKDYLCIRFYYSSLHIFKFRGKFETIFFIFGKNLESKFIDTSNYLFIFDEILKSGNIRWNFKNRMYLCSVNVWSPNIVVFDSVTILKFVFYSLYSPHCILQLY